MDNMLIQVNGIKKIVFFPPSNVDYLYMKGDKSEIIDIETPDLNQYPLFANAQKYETDLLPDDVVFIPALWLHNVIAKTFSIGINVFWKHLDDSFYDKQDLYGNKDLVSATKAFDLTKRSIKEINNLPKGYKEFYVKRMIQLLQETL